MLMKLHILLPFVIPGLTRNPASFQIYALLDAGSSLSSI